MDELESELEAAEAARHGESCDCVECWTPDSHLSPGVANETTCPECKRDAADPKSWAYLLGKGPYCGRSDFTQPMYACRFGRAAYDEATKDWEEMRTVRIPDA